MDKQTIVEIKEIRKLLARMIGIDAFPEEGKFSEEKLNEFDALYNKLETERGEWLKGDDLHKIFPGAYWETGKFFRDTFGFSPLLQQGKSYYYNKKSIQTLVRELKDRKVNLAH